jgi:hypothetical protein
MNGASKLMQAAINANNFGTDIGAQVHVNPNRNSLNINPY